MAQVSAPNLVVRKTAKGTPIYEAKWRAGGKQHKRRLGDAWLVEDGDGGWKRRRGRVQEGFIDERRATVLAAEAVAEHAEELRRREERGAHLTFRDVAEEWLDWLEHVRRVSPATLRDYECLLREPGHRHKRSPKTSPGRIMAAFGDEDIRDITAKDVSGFLRRLDNEGLTPRNVNKHRQIVNSVFVFACRVDTHALDHNPVTATDKRREPLPAALEYYEVHEVEALAEAMAAGPHRGVSKIAVSDDELAMRAEEDARDADLFRVLLHTGLRLGELRALRWSAVDFEHRTLLVRAAVSAGVEKDPKGRRYRVVPLSSGAMTALRSQAHRTIFDGADDYVFCGRRGEVLDDSALRRRYKAACQAAGLRPVKLHGLRHAAGSLLARKGTAVEVRDFMGHAKLSTTDRYVSARFSDEFFERVDDAFAQQPAKDRAV